MSLVFNGARQNTTTSSAALFNLSFTVMCWVKVFSGTSAQCIVSEQFSGTAQAFRLYWENGTITTERGYAQGGTRYISVDSLATYPTGIYTHVAASFDGDNLRLYVDGVYQGMATTFRTPHSPVSNTLGARRTGISSWDQYLNGEILDYRHYASVLPDDQISTIACTGGLDFITLNLSERHIMFGVPGVNATSLDDWSQNNRDRTVTTTIPFG